MLSVVAVDDDNIINIMLFIDRTNTYQKFWKLIWKVLHSGKYYMCKGK